MCVTHAHVITWPSQVVIRCLKCLLRMSVYPTNAIVPLPISSVRASDSGCHLTFAGHCQSLLSRWQRILRMTVCPTNTMLLSIISPIRSSEHAQHSAYPHEASTIAQHVACPARYDVSIPSCHASDRPDLPLQPQSIPPTFCGALQLGGHTGWCRRCTGCAQWCMPDSMTERRNCRTPWKHIGSKSFRHTLRSLQAFHNVHHINKLIAHDRHTTAHRWRMDVLPT